MARLILGCFVMLAAPLLAAEKHWSYQPVVRPPVPVISGADKSLNPIDAFLLGKLHAQGLDFAPVADRRTLLRRVSFDLTGLPPTWEEVQQFKADPRADAYANVVERLLRSPHHGERMAQHWLDWVRYADTVGFHGDQPVKVWPYRDYVIEAFNRNQPFDQFTVEQLAGDLLPAPQAKQLVATAYNRLNRMTAENGANDAEYLTIYAADRVRTTASVWLGSTLGCAQCHDHKHDPFTQREFYEFAAIFADIDERGFYPKETDWGPLLTLADPKIAVARERIETRIKAADAALESRRKAIRTGLPDLAAQWRKAMLERKSFWEPMRPLKAQTDSGKVITIRDDSSMHLEQSEGGAEGYSLWLPRLREEAQALRLEILPVDGDRQTDTAKPGQEFTLLEVELFQVQDGISRPVKFASATSTPGAVGGGTEFYSIDGKPGTGWLVHSSASKEGRQLRLALSAPLQPAADTRLLMHLSVKAGGQRRLLENFRVSFTTLIRAELTPSGLEADLAALLEPKKLPETEAGKKSLEMHLMSQDAEMARLRSKRIELETQKMALQEATPAVLITQARAPRSTRVLPRGNWLDDSGPLVSSAVPMALGGRTDKPVTRLDLAHWLVDRQQPLTARVMMNRLWKLHFGRGLVATLDDFGHFGAAPTNPELLDWLAAEFMESGWDWRHMTRLIVSSRAYQQRVMPSESTAAHDPENRLWGHQEAVRLDAELIRDNALAVSGLLVKEIGGPSVRPYQPEGYYDSLSFPVRTYEPSTGPDQYRRGLYTHWQRTFLHPSLKVFDAPSREECTLARPVSNTPLQALTLLNDPTFVEAARVLAQSVIGEGAKDDEVRLERLFLRALQRLPTAAEQSLLLKLIQAERAENSPERTLLHIGQSPLPAGLDQAELVVWTQAARVVLNLSETIMRY